MSKEPLDISPFALDSTYQVDLNECESELEIRNERIASNIAEKYNLVYRQGDGIATKTSELSDGLIAARKEIEEWMPVGKIRWFSEPANVYYFTFNSWGERI